MIHQPTCLLAAVLVLSLICPVASESGDECKCDPRSVPVGACIRDTTCFDVTDGQLLFWDCPCSANWGLTATLIGCNRDHCERSSGAISGLVRCGGEERTSQAIASELGAIVFVFGGNHSCDCGTKLEIEITTRCRCYEVSGSPPAVVETCEQTEQALSVNALCGIPCTDSDGLDLTEISCP